MIWLAAVVAAFVGLGAGYGAGELRGRRQAVAARALCESARALLESARPLGFRAVVPLPATPAAMAAELRRFGEWFGMEWRRSEEERHRMGAVMQGLTEAIVLLDRQGDVLLANDAAGRLWPQLGAPGRHQHDLFQDERLDKALAEASASGQSQAADLSLPGPPRRHLRVRILPLEPVPAGGNLVVVQDVTSQRISDQIRRDFVANVSHELQTPLTSVRGYAETLADESLTAEEHERFTGHILREAERMAVLVRDLLALAQLEAPRWAPVTPVALGELAAEVVTQESSFAAERGVTLRRLPGDAVVPGRAEELRRALQNLVRNALAYTPAGGRVVIGVERRGAMAAVSVADTGIGIPPAALPRIFERFYRVDPGRSRDTGGTGLGLAIVKHTAEGHGGRVEVQSTLGQGSTFTLLLPTRPGDGHAPSPEIDGVSAGTAGH